MLVRIIHGNCTGEIQDLPQPAAEAAILSGYAEEVKPEPEPAVDLGGVFEEARAAIVSAISTSGGGVAASGTTIIAGTVSSTPTSSTVSGSNAEPKKDEPQS